MKGYFVLVKTHASEDHSGVGLKVRNQIDALNQAGLNCGEVVLPVSDSRFLSIQYRLPFANAYPVWERRPEFYQADYLYMRRPFVMNVHMRRVLSDAKKKNPGLKVIVELPTYPYDAEYQTYKAWKLLLMKDKYNRVRMRGVVDRFAILTDEKEIFGIPALKIRNGINVDAVRRREPVPHEADTIHMCAVAMFKEWHGYERFIEGLKAYYEQGGSRNIICHFVGEGSELPFYQQLVENYRLKEHFVFHGYLEGAELDAVYDLCSIALGPLAAYKKQIFFSCDLKSREAVARGVPMVTGCKTDIFTAGKYPYFLEFPNDPSTLDLSRIVSFHDAVYQEGEEKVVRSIRQYAHENLGMGDAMRNVIEYIKVQA